MFWQNLKMKISNTRFLNAGNQRELNVDFPTCLEKKMNVEQSGGHANVNKMLQNVFHFPEVSLECFPVHALPTIYIKLVAPHWFSFINFTFVYASGHISAGGNIIILASLVSCCCSWKYFFVHYNILWNGRCIKHHEILHSTHAL